MCARLKVNTLEQSFCQLFASVCVGLCLFRHVFSFFQPLPRAPLVRPRNSPRPRHARTSSRRVLPRTVAITTADKTALPIRGPRTMYSTKSDVSRSSASTGDAMHGADATVSEGVVEREPQGPTSRSDTDTDDTQGWSNYKVRQRPIPRHDVPTLPAHRNGKKKSNSRAGSRLIRPSLTASPVVSCRP